jgi:hypothetical protein
MLKIGLDMEQMGLFMLCNRSGKLAKAHTPRVLLEVYRR